MNAVILPIAHAGHWIQYVLYALPLLVVVGSIVGSIARDRRTANDQPS